MNSRAQNEFGEKVGQRQTTVAVVVVVVVVNVVVVEAKLTLRGGIFGMA